MHIVHQTAPAVVHAKADFQMVKKSLKTAQSEMEGSVSPQCSPHLFKLTAAPDRLLEEETEIQL